MLILGLPVFGLSYLLASLSRKPITVLWRWSKPSAPRRVASALTAVAVLGLVVFLWAPQLPFSAKVVEPTGLQHLDVIGRTHVEGPVAYPLTPPVGGNHAPIWQNCGFYDTLVPRENAVHSLEHGAAWITYQSGLRREQIEALRRLAHDQTYVLVSPYPDLPAPVVASAWGRQLRLDSADDPRLRQFLQAFRLGSQAPEPGEPCSGGMGLPI
jgi:hypothetical protein